MKVMIVNDDTDYVEELVHALRKRGAEATGVTDERTAKQVAEAFGPELVILDWDFSQGSCTHALTVKSDIRSVSGCNDVPIVTASKFTDRSVCVSENAAWSAAGEKSVSIQLDDTVPLIVAVMAGSADIWQATRDAAKVMGYFA